MDRYLSFTVHGVPNYAHDWVSAPPETFKRYMQYLYDHHYPVTAMRDLQKSAAFDLQYKHLIEPLGIDAMHPRLSCVVFPKKI